MTIYSRASKRWVGQFGGCGTSLACSLGMAVMTAPAQAQQPAVADVPRAVEIEEVIVEARRRSESMQDVPITIQAVSEETLRNYAVSGIKGLTQFSPGLNLSEDVDGNGVRIFIRGVGTSTPVWGSEPAVPIYLDDVYTPLGLGGNIDLFSIDRVEVLSGPQGTLYGRNSFGGAVKIYSKGFTNETELDLTTQVGSFSQRNVKAEIRTPVIDERLWIGAAYASIQNDGIQKLTALGTRGWDDDKELYRIRLEARPTDDLTLKLSYSLSDSGGIAKQPKFEAGTNADLSGLFLSALPGIGAQIDSMPVLTDTDPDHIASNIAAETRAKLTSYTWSANYELSDSIHLVYLGGDHRLENLRAFDNDGTPAPFLDAIQDITIEGQSHELQFQWNTESFNFILGAFHYEEDQDVYGLLHSAFGAGFVEAVAPGTLSVLTDITGLNTSVNAAQWNNPVVQNTESLALYTNFGVNFTERLRATFGARWTRDDKFSDSPVEAQNFVYNPALSPHSGNVFPPQGIKHIPLPGGLYDPNNLGMNTAGFDLTGVPGVDQFGITGPVERRFEEVTFEATLDYRLTPSTLVYTSFKQGFQGGTLFPNALANLIDEEYDAFDGFEQSTEEQTINAYELGLKTTLLDGRWQINAAAYYYDFDDLIISVLTPVPTEVSLSGFLPVPQNAGRAASLGFDFDTAFVITDSLMVRANVGYVDFDLEEVMAASATGMQNIADTFNDEYVAGAPQWKGSFGIDYLPSASVFAGNLRLWANVAWRGKMNTNGGDPSASTGFGLLPASANEESFISEAHENVSAGVSWVTRDERWQLDLSGSNLLDQRRFESTPFDSTGLLGLPHGYNKPRMWLFGVRYRL